MLAQEHRSLAAELAIAPAIPWRIRMILKIEPARVELRLAGAAKLFILPAQERDVRIIVPGNEAVMPYGTEQRPRDDVVMDATFPADAIRFREQFELDALELPELVACKLYHFDRDYSLLPSD